MISVESALRSEAQKRVRALGQADVVVGLPTYKNAKTIANVMQIAAEGALQCVPDGKVILVVADGMSTDDTLQVASHARLPRNAQKVVTTYQGIMGKGSAMRAIFEVAEHVKATACVVIDADLRSITPDWIVRLSKPVIDGMADYVTPYYSRHSHEVTINDNLAYPLTRALYGLDVRQPLGGEVALSAPIMASFLNHDVWETDVARFGIHVWMTTLAINEGWKLGQAPLGTKTHDFRDPTVGFEPKFLQVVSTLFRLISIYRRKWPSISHTMPIPVYGDFVRMEPEPVPAMRQAIREAIRKGTRRFRPSWEVVLQEDSLTEVLEVLNAEGNVVFPADLWSRIVYDFAVLYNKGEGDPDKVVMALLPLYYARKVSMIQEVDGFNYAQIEDHIRRQAEIFLGLKPYLIQRWNNFMPWDSDF
ncbi:MAG: glycosyltransferase [Anaerolineae bacterium]